MDMRKVLLTGGSRLPKDLCGLVQELGRQLITKTEFQVITGGLQERDEGIPTTDYEAVKGARDGLKERGGDASQRIITMLPDADVAGTTRFEEGNIVRVKRSSTKARRYSMALSCDAVIAIAGADGTSEIVDLAWIAGKPVIPISGTGGAALERWKKYKPDLTQRLQLTKEEIQAFEAVPLQPGPTAAMCIGVLRRVLRPCCFVAMKFQEHPLAGCFETIRTQAEEKGFSVVRLDQEIFIGNIVEEIWNTIRNCEIVIADLTNGNLNVFYELGISHAYGKQTMLLVFDRGAKVPAYIPFDIRQQRIFPYGTLDSLTEQLRKHLPDANFSQGGRIF